MVLAAAVGMAAPVTAESAIVFQRSTGPQDRMYIAGNDGTGVHRLPVAGGSPTISPDGTRLAYQAATRAAPLRILTLATGAVVTPAGGCQAQVTWSPDSTRLLCQTQTVDRRDFVTGNGLLLVDAAAGTVTTLVAARGNSVDTFGWSPDGTRVAYSRGRFGGARTDVFVADPAGTVAPRRVITDATGPVWGPRRIAVTRYTHRRVRVGAIPDDVVHSQIWTVNPGGGGAHRLTHDPVPPFLIEGPSADRWTPDGTRLVASVTGHRLRGGSSPWTPPRGAPGACNPAASSSPRWWGCHRTGGRCW
ncbi:MAG: hypothetical protein U0Y82_06145 [Thermoleophilia bacterium]